MDSIKEKHNMVGNEMNEGITSFPSSCENSSIKPNGVGSNDGYLEESPTKHTTDNGLVGNLLQYQFEILFHFIVKTHNIR